jgi:hypothetical protein
MIPVIPLKKSGSGQRQLIDKVQQGNRMIYHYLNADGTRKTVTKPYDPAKARKPKEIHGKVRQTTTGVTSEPTTTEKAPKAKPSKEQKYLPPTASETVSNLFGGMAKKENKTLNSLSGIPYTWEIFKVNNKEAQVFEGKKFRVIINNINNLSDKEVSIDVRVFNLQAGKFIYSKRVKLSTDTNENLIRSLSTLTFINPDQPIIESVNNYLSSISPTDGCDALSALKLALEKRYFTQKEQLN